MPAVLLGGVLCLALWIPASIIVAPLYIWKATRPAAKWVWGIFPGYMAAISDPN